jgi:RNA polymerase sigma-70 factor (ECF subfamily)
MKRSDMGREEYFESLMTEQIRRALLKIARRFDRFNAEDILQETMLRIWQCLDDYTYGSFFVWSCKILRNCAANSWRSMTRVRKGVRIKRELISFDISEFEYMANDQAVFELNDELNLALKNIKPNLRDMILLVAVDDLSYDEAAKKVGVPIGTVMSRVHRAKTKMRELLEIAS